MRSTRTRGKKGQRHADPADPPRRRANKRPGHGTYETDRPPIFGLRARGSGEIRYFVRHPADKGTCREVVTGTVARGSPLYTDEWQSYNEVGREWCVVHARVRHGKDRQTGRREWARDDDGDGIGEVHCNGCEGLGTGLRNFLRPLRGVNKQYLWDYLAVFEGSHQ